MEENATLPVKKRKNGIGTAGFVISLVSLGLLILVLIGLRVTYNDDAVHTSLFLPLFLAFLLNIPGLVLSIIGVAKRNAKKGLAIVGLCISGCIFVIPAIITLYVMCGFF